MVSNEDKLRQCYNMVEALHQAMDASRNAQRYSGFKQFARKFQQIASLVTSEIDLPKVIDVWDAETLPRRSSTRIFQQQEYFEGTYVNLVILKAYLETQTGIVDDEIQVLRDFFKSRLRSAIFEIPESEKEVQDVIERLLIGRGMQKAEDYDREVGRVRHSSKEVIPDFAILKLSCALEVKLIKQTSRIGNVVDEISADILSYSKEYKRILFIIYDLGQIRNEVEFRRDLENNSYVTVVIVKH